MKPTVTDPSLRTFQNIKKGNVDWTVRNPWRSPGHAPVFSPCGMAGGGNTPGAWMSESLTQHIQSGAVTPPFIRRGVDARDLPPAPKAIWPAGSIQDVAWSIFANKGGGYAWRLCPKSTTGQPDNITLTEECFQAGQLEYASDDSWIQHHDQTGRANRSYFEASRVSVGTMPAGSTWTKNPIPPCANADGSPVTEPSKGCPGPMFEPAVPGLYGDGVGSCITWAIHGPVEGYHTLYDSFGAIVYQAPCTAQQALDTSYQFQFSIFDAVKVPATLVPGEYALSFRLDAEQTPQVWTQCADVTVTPAAAAAASKSQNGTGTGAGAEVGAGAGAALLRAPAAAAATATATATPGTCDLDHYNVCAESLEQHAAECAGAGAGAKVQSCLGFFFGGDETVQYCRPCIEFYANKYNLLALKLKAK